MGVHFYEWSEDMTMSVIMTIPKDRNDYNYMSSPPQFKTIYSGSEKVISFSPNEPDKRIKYYARRKFTRDEKIGFTLVDHSFNTVFTKFVSLPYNGKEVSVHKAYMTKEKKIIVTLGIENPQFMGTDKNSYAIMILDQNQENPQFIDINPSGTFMGAIRFILKGNTLVALGFIGKKNSESFSQYFWKKIDLSKNQAINEKEIPLTKTFIKEIENLSKSDKSFVLRRFDPLPDGGFLVLTENIKYKTIGNLYYSSSIHFMKLSENGDVLFDNFVGKLRSEYDRLEIVTFATEKRTFLLFYGDIKDLPSYTDPKDKYKASKNRGHLVIASIDNLTGEASEQFVKCVELKCELSLSVIDLVDLINKQMVLSTCDWCEEKATKSYKYFFCDDEQLTIEFK